tara:strand:+ start:2357 stop:2620 length:264 start_codon:yes stop_codon:yes gene_type:complete
MVCIGSNVYEMNEQANQPNGVCIYHGNTDEDSELAELFRVAKNVDDVPIGMVRQIANLIEVWLPKEQTKVDRTSKEAWLAERKIARR